MAIAAQPQCRVNFLAIMHALNVGFRCSAHHRKARQQIDKGSGNRLELNLLDVETNRVGFSTLQPNL